jgi:hypothetical protein
MKLERLPRHITSFFDYKSERICSLDLAEFKSACFHVARAAGAAIKDFDNNLLGRSFYTATMKTSEEEISILCNWAYPYVTFVPVEAYERSASGLAFCYPELVSSLFLQETKFDPLDADWLMSAPTEYLLSDLCSAERKQMKYGIPLRVGDIIFNHWD